MITLAIAEDHQVLIDGIKSIFEYDEDINIIGSVNNGLDLVKLVSLKQPKIVLTDIRMPKMNGIEATKEIKTKFPHIKVLALTMFDQPEIVDEMLNAGASGYLLKNSGVKIISEAIMAVAKGETFYDPNVLIDGGKGKPRKKRDSKTVVLSNREKEILNYIAKGNTSKEIAETLHIAKYTVDTHRKNMIRKLNLKNGNDLIRYAIEKKYN